MDLNLLSMDAVFTELVVVAAIETERYPLIETLLANSVLDAPAEVAGPVDAAGAWVAGVSAVVLDPPPPPPHPMRVIAVNAEASARLNELDFILFPGFLKMSYGSL